MNIMRKLRILGTALLIFAGVFTTTGIKAQPGVRVSFKTFYEDLSPYGRWINSPQYGSVWRPDVEPGFQPYSTNGYWEVTEYGNTWVSAYDWGWAPFHYGRWSYDDFNGWFWIPDYEWGPAWVNWRSGGGYYGWAPLGPGVNINVSVNIPSFWWVFVPQRYITSPRWHSYCAPRNRVTRVYNNTVIINNYYRNDNRTYVYGPRRDEIERVTRRSVPVRTIDASPRGRGRVIVAENSRGNDRYSPSYDRNSRVERSSERPRTIEAAPDRRGRNERAEDSRTGANYDYNRNNSRPNRESAPEVSRPSDSRSSREYEPSRNPSPEREIRRPDYNSERNSRSSRQSEPAPQNRSSNDFPPARPERSERSSGESRSRPSAPSESRSRSNESRGSSQGSERSSRGNSDRGSGGGERSSRSPR